MPQLTSTCFDDLEVGQNISFDKTLTEEAIELFGKTSGDINPVHFDQAYAEGTIFKQRIGHGMWSASLISTCIGTLLPGPGSIYLGQELKFRKPVFIGDTLTAAVTVKEKIDKRKWVILDCKVTNQDGELVSAGDATVMPPAESGTIEVEDLS